MSQWLGDNWASCLSLVSDVFDDVLFSALIPLAEIASDLLTRLLIFKGFLLWTGWRRKLKVTELTQVCMHKMLDKMEMVVFKWWICYLFHLLHLLISFYFCCLFWRSSEGDVVNIWNVVLDWFYLILLVTVIYRCSVFCSMLYTVMCFLLEVCWCFWLFWGHLL